NEIYDETKRQTRPEFQLEKVEPRSEDINQQRFELSERVRKRELFGFFEIGSEVLKVPAMAAKGGKGPPSQPPNDAHVVRYQSNSPTYDAGSKWLGAVLNQLVQERRWDTILGKKDATKNDEQDK